MREFKTALVFVMTIFIVSTGLGVLLCNLPEIVNLSSGDNLKDFLLSVGISFVFLMIVGALAKVFCGIIEDDFE